MGPLEMYLNKAAKTFGDAQSDDAKKAEFTRAHNDVVKLSTLESWHPNSPFGTLIGLASIHLQSSVFSSSIGAYSQCYYSMRSALELVLAGFEFQSDEAKFLKWKRGSQDINWGALTDNENGPLSNSRLRLYNEDLIEQGLQYREVCLKLYREMSQVVHANPGNPTVDLNPFEFDENTHRSVLESIGTLVDIAVFLHVLRRSVSLSEEQRQEEADLLLEHFGQIEAVRDLYDEQ